MAEHRFRTWLTFTGNFKAISGFLGESRVHRFRESHGYPTLCTKDLSQNKKTVAVREI